jgi:hypothetical protein
MSDAVGIANSYSPPPQGRFAAGLRGFGPVGILAVLVIAAGQVVAPLSALLFGPMSKLQGLIDANLSLRGAQLIF